MSSRPGLDRAAVVQAAATLADTVGLEEVTLASLAAHLKIRTPSLYNHIEGLPGLRRELALLCLKELSQRLGRVVMGKSHDEAVLALCHAYRAFVKEHPGLYMAIAGAPSADDTELQKASQELIDIIVSVLAGYGLQGDEAIHIVRGWRSLLHGFCTLEIAHGFGIPLELNESFDHLIHTFLLGVKQHS